MCCPFPTTRIQTMLLSSLVSSPQESSLPGFSKNVFVFVCVCVCVCVPCLAHVHVHKGRYVAVKHLHTGLCGGEEPPVTVPTVLRECAGLKTCPVSNWSASFTAKAPSVGALGPVPSTQFPRLILFHLFLDFQKFVEISHVLNGLLPIFFIIMSCAFLISLFF